MKTRKKEKKMEEEDSGADNGSNIQRSIQTSEIILYTASCLFHRFV